jgi:tRNA pseudouridine38-40 synthase
MQRESSGRTQAPPRRESAVRAIKLVLAYDGSDFSGWQRQKNGRSVQEELEKALAKMHGHEIRVTGAGRTDAGVHAMGQVAGFYTDIRSIPADRFVPALNKLMPRDVRVLSSEEAPPDFHARFDASLRRYRYFLVCGSTPDPFALRYAHCIPYYPRVAVLNAAAAVVLGEHDFSTFASAQDKSESRSRHISESVFFFEGGRLVYQVAGNAFLWRQVRSLVGSFLEIERSAENPAQGEALMRELLESRDRGRAGATAPACGLFLWNVEYGERVHGHPRRRGGTEKEGGRTSGAVSGAASPGSRLVPGLGWIDEGE